MVDLKDCTVQRLKATVDAEIAKAPPAEGAVPLPVKITLLNSTDDPVETTKALIFRGAKL